MRDAIVWSEAGAPSSRGSDGRPVLEVRNLSVEYATPAGPVVAVRNASLVIGRGEVVGIVGESGCGKSSLAFAIMGYLGPAGRATGAVFLDGRDLLRMSAAELQEIRGARLAMVYQDPLGTLNPSLTVGEQIAEVIRCHRLASREEAWRQAVSMLARVGLADPVETARRYPHQLSGGMQQRVVIAMALCCDPAVLIMDEPTTALDVTTEARILDLVNTLRREFDSAILYISHNLGVIAQVCDRLAVMYAGEIVEEGTAQQIFRSPRHPYTIGLLGCVPRIDVGKEDAPLRPIPGRVPSRNRPSRGCAFAGRCSIARGLCAVRVPELVEVAVGHRTRCHFWQETRSAEDRTVAADTRSAQVRSLADELTAHGIAEWSGRVVGRTVDVRHTGRNHSDPVLRVRDLRCYYDASDGLARIFARLSGRMDHPVRAVDGISLSVPPGQTLALVGESGSGKTTLARAIVGLVDIRSGQITFEGADISQPVERRSPEVRRHIQMVFQNPEASLNPRQTVGTALERPLRRFLGLAPGAARQYAARLLQALGLDASYLDRYPRQLSGGEKQRVAIARAFASLPRLVVLDEPVSALDVSVQASVLNLLVDLQRALGTSYVFISHDLGVVRYVADQIAVVYLGQLCELGPARTLREPPHHPYTEALLAAVPIPDPDRRSDYGRIRLEGAVPSPRHPPRGCPFHARCPRKLGEICEMVPPPVRTGPDGRHVRCHIPLEDLRAMQGA
ncbi:MAG: ABC transporter ATP-binding protein [Chloroflexi bacterium]|nr:ABC transporter ATP-binding protein [Chloroflexota bacterium]